MEDPCGIACVYKPRGVSSFAVTRAFRRQFSVRKVGHAGTLDPLAEGLLILGFGRGTKALSSLQGLKKTYRAVFLLGTESSTEDGEGELSFQTPKNLLSLRRLTYRSLEKAAEKFRGEIDQVPSRFSAVHFNGERAYDLARSGKDFELDPRKVQIYSLKLLKLRGLSPREKGKL